MNASVGMDSLAKQLPLRRELLTIFLFYLKIFLLSLIVGSVFFLLYSGIKTNRIPLDLVAVVLGALGSVTVGLTTFYYIERLRREPSKPRHFADLVKESSELERLRFEIKELDLELKEEMYRLQPDQEIQVFVAADIERRKANLLVRFIDPTPVLLRVLAFQLLKLVLGFSVGFASATKPEKKERAS